MAGAGSEGDAAAKAEIDWLIEFVSQVRGCAPSQRAVDRDAGATDRQWLVDQVQARRQATILRDGKLGPRGVDAEPEGSAKIASGGDLRLRPGEHIDLNAERSAFRRAAAAEKDRDGLAARSQTRLHRA